MQKLFNRTTIAVCVSAALVATAATYLNNTDVSGVYQISPEKQAFLAQKQAKKNAHPKRFDKPQEAVDFYIQQRAPLGETTIPNERYGKALRHMANMQQYAIKSNKLMPARSQMSNVNMTGATPIAPGVVKEWENLGPGNIGGRTRALVIDPQTPETMYSAGVAGGIWKSTDAGENWVALDDMMVNLAVTTLTLSPTDNKTLYAGTGEGFFNGDALRGDGVFKSTDAGATWQQIESTSNNPDFRYINKIEASTLVEGRLFAATRGGLFRSDDAGETWSQLRDGTSWVGCLDIKLSNDGETEQMLLSCGSFGVATVYHSADGGETITPVIEDELLGRTTLTYSPSHPNIAYALAATNQNDATPYSLGFYKLYRSEDGGLTWEVKNSNTNDNVINTLLLSNPVYGAFPACGWGESQFYNQGWYDNIIQVDPINPEIVWAGGVDLWRSDDAGANWDVVSRWWDDVTAPTYAHADQHAIVFHPNYDGETNKTLFVGNDGGIQRTDNTDGGTLGIDGICGAPVTDTVNWTSLNNDYAVTQFYHGAVYPDGTAFIGGTQDNGTNWGGESSNEWLEVSGGDGGWVAIDPRNPDIIFSEYTGLSLQRWMPDFGWVSATNGIEDGYMFPFTTPYVMDSNNPDVLWIGNDRLWRTNDQGDNWVQASTNTPDGSIVSEWAVAPGNSDLVMAGTNSGMILMNKSASIANATTEWSVTQPTQGYVSDLAIDPVDNSIAYATYSTFGVDHIWKTVNGGIHWSAIDNQDEDNGLPDVPVNSIVIDPENTQHIFVGTDLGIFVSIDAGQNWTVDGSGFANTAVAHLEINNGQLYAFTHGRSAYRVDLSKLSDALTIATVTDEDTSLALSAEMFTYAGTPEVDAIKFTHVSNGSLQLAGEDVDLSAAVAVADLENLSFVPSTDYNGDANIEWHAQANEETSSNNAEITIDIAAVNDAPTFSLAGDSYARVGDNALVNLANVTPNAVPSDEAEQTVTYTLSPASVNELDIMFNESTGELNVFPRGKKPTEVTFTITANDNQAENNTHSEDVTLTLDKKYSSGGSMGWFALLSLPLVALRRRFTSK